MATVLLVDDEPKVLAALNHHLIGGGHSVLAFTSGARAVEVTESPDVALLDIQMPGLNGPEVARQLRARWPRLPIVFVTGGTSAKLLEEAKEFGPVVNKPPDPQDLLLIVQELSQ